MDICTHISPFLFFTIQSGNINTTLQKNGTMKLQPHVNSQTCFNQMYSLSFNKWVFWVSIFFKILSIIWCVFLTVLPHFKTNRSLIVEILPFWPMPLQSDLHLWPLWPWLSLSLTLTLQHPGCVSYILQQTWHLEKNVRVKMSCWWAYPICIENSSVLHRLWLLHNVSFCYLDKQKSLNFAQDNFYAIRSWFNA